MNRLIDTQALIGRITDQMRRFDQDRRNARMIGEMVVRQFGSRLYRPSPTPSPTDHARSPVDSSLGRSLARNEHSEVERWALLSAAELIARVDELSIADLDALHEAEARGRNRAAVLDAIERRRGHVDT